MPQERPFLLHTCATFSELPSYISTTVPTSFPGGKEWPGVCLYVHILVECREATCFFQPSERRTMVMYYMVDQYLNIRAFVWKREI